MSGWDLCAYLPDDILVKVDRASMSVGLEAREPFLDQDVIALAMKMPQSYKFSGGVSKYVLKDILSDILPRALFDRPKHGFRVPLKKWARTPGVFREYIRDTRDAILDIDPSILDHKMAVQIIDEYLAGRGNDFSKVWFVVVFVAWYRAWYR
jgi:asparagine synthase (glutamine-hydrolysing)